MPTVITIPEELAYELDRLAEAEHKLRTAYVVDVRCPAQQTARMAEGTAAQGEQIRSEPHQ